MKPSEYVAEVADHLVANGWAQNSLFDGNGGSCLRGAMLTVTWKNFTTPQKSGTEDCGTRVCRFIQSKVAARGYGTISSWNDAPGRTLNDVLDFLHQCKIGLKELEE
jgi:hypothetical protein